MFYYLRFLLPVNIERTPCPILRSKPSLVVGMPVMRATFVFKPLIPTARFSENVNPFMVVKFIFIFPPAKLLLFRDIYMVLFGPFAFSTCLCPIIVVLLQRFLASVHTQKSTNVLVHALRS